MMKRVCNSRFAKSALVLAVCLLVSGVGAPVWARENMSAGQAGDPGDGLDVISGGSNGSTMDDNNNSTVNVVRPAPSIRNHDVVLLVPYFNGSSVRFVIIANVRQMLEYLK